VTEGPPTTRGKRDHGRRGATASGGAEPSLREEAPEPAPGDPSRGPAGDPLADPAVLDRLVVAEEAGELVENPSGLAYRYTGRVIP
jgi:hypothetical protein